MTPKEKMARARASLVLGSPFFGALALRLRLKEDEVYETMAVDGTTIFYNAEFVKKLPQSQVLGVVAHEVLHVAFIHHARRQGRDRVKWNIACDFAINLILKANSFDLPKDGLLDPQYKDMTAEKIYALLPDPQVRILCGKDPGVDGVRGKRPWDFGEVLDAPHNIQEAEAKAKIDLASATHICRQMGKMPLGMERLIDEMLETQIPWKNVLWRFCTEPLPGDTSWSRPNRRFIDAGAYLPSMWNDDGRMKDIVVAVDTSGSISDTELAQFGGEINGIHQSVRPRQTVVIYCDAAVQQVDVFGPDDDVTIEHKGGGGTDFRPPFSKVEEMGLSPRALVYLTDGYGTFPPEEEVPYPVIWGMTTDVNPPFGECIRIR